MRRISYKKRQGFLPIFTNDIQSIYSEYKLTYITCIIIRNAIINIDHLKLSAGSLKTADDRC